MITLAFFVTSVFFTKFLAKLGGPDPSALIDLVFSRKIVATAPSNLAH